MVISMRLFAELLPRDRPAPFVCEAGLIARVSHLSLYRVPFSRRQRQAGLPVSQWLVRTICVPMLAPLSAFNARPWISSLKIIPLRNVQVQVGIMRLHPLASRTGLASRSVPQALYTRASP